MQVGHAVDVGGPGTDRDNYAILMRVAMLSSLDGNDTTGNLGFRCARDLPTENDR